MKKFAIITTHPIQYNAPFFKLLAERNNISVKVFYTWSQSASGSKFDPGFGKEIIWDIPLLSGYDYCFVKNISTTPGSHHYKGIDNPSLIKEVTEWKADVVLIYGWNFRSHLKAMRYFKGKIPVFFRGDSTLLDEKPGLKKIIRRIILTGVYKNIDRACYAGKQNKAYFKVHGLKENELIFMPHAVDNKNFNPTHAHQKNGLLIRDKLNIKHDDTVFLFAGKLEPKKQPDKLVQIFKNFTAQNVHLIIAGNGILENDLKNIAGNTLHIHFLPFQNQTQMPALYASCNVFVLPSAGPNETWGLSINEAMAAGKPVIVSDACGAAIDLVNENSTGFIFPKNDFLRLEQYINFYIDNPELAFTHGKNAQLLIENFSYLNDCIALENAVNG
jgi:glycosyltransferase involved in cell wall biosynthesis